MQFQNLLTRIAALLALTVLSVVCCAQADLDQLFSQAVQDYTQNRFSDASAKFAKVEGSHAQEAQQYLAKINAYKDAMSVAKGIMGRSADELDSSSIDFAIQKYEDAIKIKSDGPWHPADELEKAKSTKAQLEQKRAASSQAMDRDFCQKAVGAKEEHHFKEAASYACPLANDNPAYSCGGDEAVHLCQQMTELAKLDTRSGTKIDSKAPAGAASPRLPAPGDNVLDQAQAAYDSNDFPRARILFGLTPEEVRPVANEFLDKMSRYQDSVAQAEKLSKSGQYEEARNAYANAMNIKPDGPGDPHAKALLMELAEGLDQFYSGDYASASQHLDAYARASGEKQTLAHFYLGASKLARFFLTGSQDAGLRQDALNDFKIAKQAGFKADAQDVSPKLLQAYKDLNF